MLFLLLFSVVFGKTENITIFSNPEVDVTVKVKVNSNWLEKGGYEFELKITPSNDLIKDETNDWQICFDTPMPTGQTQEEMEEARKEPGLALNFRNCTVFQFPGTHRCLRKCDTHLKGETIIYKITANPHSLAKSDFFGNFYTIQNFAQEIGEGEAGISSSETISSIQSTSCTNVWCKTQDFVENPTEENQLLNKNTSFWLPWTPEQRFERNLNDNEISSDDSIAPIDSESLEIRSLHVDIARNFHGVETLEKILKEMSEVNMTHLHIHATDDEGWRIEIPELPELTTIGAHRCANKEDECMIPQD
ncbi:unnamed protein product [Oikopleura dioica]|uniref:beta-N-acetylhexosaminidase n=1 Tax=Oikopleura dioica TaxID=34765 RepID=E4XD41_OIKDI|nr:unnamed protein product [Oikopleura dioica]